MCKHDKSALYERAVEQGVAITQTHNEIARKIFLCYPTYAFNNQLELEFEIRNKIANFFKIPILSVQFCGSAKLGFSYHKKTPFTSETSDLDVSIISEMLYIKYLNLAFRVTDGYSDLSKFLSTKKLSASLVHQGFIDNSMRGFIRPDLLPSCEEKLSWFNFFNKLSTQYIYFFKNINAGIYCNEYFYESKQSTVVKQYLEDRVQNDKISG